MNFIHLTSVLFQQVVEAALFGSILAVLVLAIQCVAGKRLGPAWRHALWLIVLLRLSVPFFPESRFSVFNAPHWVKLATAPERRVTVTLLEPVPSPELASVQFEATSPEVLMAFQAGEPPVSKQTLSLRECLGLLWLGASLLLLLRLGIGNCWLRLRL
jgi:beta-lactamase regulating signal transducer with metallopeptidase domain